MENEVIVALIGLGGSAIGSFGGVIASARLTAYRIKKLEEKVDKHNNFAERIPVIEEKIKVEQHRMEDVENRLDKMSDRMTRRDSI